MGEAIVKIEMLDGTIISGKAKWLTKSLIELRRQRRIMPEVLLEDYIRCSSDIGEPLFIPKADIRTIKELKYDDISFVGDAEIKGFTWAGFVSYQTCGFEDGITQYNIDGFPKVINGCLVK